MDKLLTIVKDKFNNCKSENDKARIMAKFMLNSGVKINLIAQFTGL